MTKVLGNAVLWLVVCMASLVAAADTPPAKLLADGRVDDAIAALQSRLRGSPADAEAHNLLCRAYFALGQWDDGIASCEKAVNLDPGKGHYHLWLARIYGEKADRSNFFTAARLAGKVRNEFETAARLNPESVEARADLAEFYLAAPGIVGGGRDKAEAQVDEIAKREPDQAHLLKARIAEKKKDLSGAEKEYRVAIQTGGGKAGLWINLARFYRRNGRLDEMEDAIRHATDPQLNRPDVLMPAAEILIDSARDLDGAATLLRRYLASGASVEDAPVFKAHYLLGTLLEKRGDKQGAAQEYRAALSLAKNYSVAQKALNALQR